MYKWKIKDDYAGGVPDAWYCGAHGTLFVEYKYVPKLPKRESTIIKADLSELQYLWLTQRKKQNVDCLVILGTPLGGVVFTDIDEAKKGIILSELRERVQPNKKIADFIASQCLGKELNAQHHKPRPESSTELS